MLSIGLLSAAVVLFVYPRKSDVDHYRRLVLSSAEGASVTDKAGKNYVAKQQRSGVNKEIFFEDENGQRLRLIISSETSDIIFDQQEERGEIFEKLHHVVCCMQEEIFYKTADGRDVEKREDGHFVLRGVPQNKQEPISFDEAELIPQQLVRYIEADEALYNFHTQTLVALNSQVARYLISGHRIPLTLHEESPVMEGTASKVTVSIINNRIGFAATDLKAKLYSLRNMP